MRSLKGQSIVFEQVLLFSIGVGIFVVCFAVFTIYQNFYLSLGSNDQLDKVTEWVSLGILKVAEKGGSATAVSTIPIPREIGNAAYKIELSSSGLEVTDLLTSKKKSSTLYYLNETFTFSGKVISQKGRLTIKKDANQIIII